MIDDHSERALSRRIVNDRETFLELLGGLEGENQIAVEATYGWEWLAELLEDAPTAAASALSRPCWRFGRWWYSAPRWCSTA